MSEAGQTIEMSGAQRPRRKVMPYHVGIPIQLIDEGGENQGS